MPIHPDNKARYPKEWPTISKRIRFERAGGRCECEGECGHDHGGRCEALHGDPHPITESKVVLTTAHLNHTPEDCRDEVLKAMCQRCHNSYDQSHRQANRAKRLEESKAKERAKMSQTTALLAFHTECRTGRKVAR